MAGKFTNDQVLSRRSARKIAAIYAGFGGAWILTTTLALGRIEDAQAALFETGKGLLYVASTTCMLYWLLAKYTAAVTAARDQAFENEQKVREIFQHFNDGIVTLAVNRDETSCTFMEANHAFFAMTGYRDEDLNGPEMSIVANRLLERLLAEGHVTERIELPLRDGTRLPAEVHSRMFDRKDHKVIVSVVRDIRERMKTEMEIQHLAYHDRLTELANSHSFYRSIRQLMEASRPFSVIVIVINRFYEIQEAFGRQEGNQLIRIAADRLRNCLAAGDILARIDNTTFKMIVAEEGREAVERKVRLIRDKFMHPIAIGEDEVSPDVKLGVASYPADGTDEDTLVRRAYHSLRSTQDKDAVYAQDHSESDKRSRRKLLLENDLKKSIMLNQLSLHFQPKVDLDAHAVVGMEALVRWNHPKHGMIPPGEFIAIAEENGYINSMGQWILHHACQRAKDLQHRCGIFVPVAVNISLIQFMQGDVVQTVREALDASGLDASYLVLEITESMTMNPRTAMEILTKLKLMGVKTSLDDFGTGFSSLAYLKQFPIDELKIDKTFIDDLISNANDRNIVKSIIAMAHNLKMTVVAEGVEHREQLECLQQLGCDAVQGYYISRPLEYEALIAFIGGTVAVE